MKTTLSSAFGLALLAASLCFGSAFACSNSGETLTSIVNAQTAENDQPQGGDVNQAEAVKAEQPPVGDVAQEQAANIDQAAAGEDNQAQAAKVDEPQVGEVDQPKAGEVDQASSVISGSESSSSDETSSPAAVAADAIVVEITQSVTVAVPGENAGEEQPTAPITGEVTGSIETGSAESTASDSSEKATSDSSQSVTSDSSGLAASESPGAAPSEESPAADISPAVSEVTGSITPDVPDAVASPAAQAPVVPDLDRAELDDMGS
jgi:hypothetical protein